MTAIVAHQSRETPVRPASGQVLPGEFALQDGTPAMLWPLLPTDAETLRDVFRRLSPGSRYHRFLQVLDQLDDPMIRLLVDTRLRTIVAAGNRASLALLARAGRMSAGLPEQGVLDVTVDLPAATRARSTAEKVAGLWALGARKLIDQTYMVPLLPQAGLIAAVERYFEFMQRMAQMNRDLTVERVQAASALSGAAWEQAPAEPAGDVVREPAATAGR